MIINKRSKLCIISHFSLHKKENKDPSLIYIDIASRLYSRTLQNAN